MFVALNPERHRGRAIGTGHCVPFVQHAAGAPHTSRWRQGPRVRGNNVPTGTVIATFGGNPPRYQNRTDGSSHAAILIIEEPNGLRVWDQWVGQPVHQRTLQFRGGSGRASNDGDRFHVVVVAGEVT